MNMRFTIYYLAHNHKYSVVVITEVTCVYDESGANFP